MNGLHRNLARSMLLLALCCWPCLTVATELYRSRSLTPQHRRELERAIAQCVREISLAKDPNTRTQLQEELCKKLIQTEDYDTALLVAQEIYNTQGINPERRAVHHFLIAQIYAMRMEASPSLELMEKNRQAAIAAAEEVVQARYPRKWLISESAAQLLKTLRDPQHIRLVRGWVEKRQSQSGESPSRISAARAQTVAAERALQTSGKGSWAPESSSFNAEGAPKSSPLTQGKASVSYSRAAGEENSAAVRASRTPTSDSAKPRSEATPVVIEGSKIQPLWRVPPAASPYAPGAAPPTNDPIASQYGFRSDSSKRSIK